MQRSDILAGRSSLSAKLHPSAWLAACLAALSGCAPAGVESAGPMPDQSGPVTFAAREWAGHDDGRVYGGIISPSDTLSGTLGTYRGCLVEVRSGTLVVLSGAMEFHQPDAHSGQPHVLSKTILGDGPAQVIPVGGQFVSEGLKSKRMPDSIRLAEPVPGPCAGLPVFLTSSETMRPS